jgi:catechol 2,3-dioxygenase-like lactoylglutathione lyase family enzyme
MAYSKRAYLEHAAIRVRDIEWHIRFFRDVLGMTLRDDRRGQTPSQAWTFGGVQLIADLDFQGTESRLAHLGVMVEDEAEVLREAASWGVSALPQGANWLRLPDGLCIEILQATGTAVADVLSIDPRAQEGDGHVG